MANAETDSAPGLLAGWSRYDADNNGTISWQELQARIEQWVERGDGLASITCVVRLGGRQTGNVQVKLIPDEALEGVIQPGETVSHPSRSSFYSIPQKLKAEEHRHFAGMQYGLYRVEVSHPQDELIAAANSRGIDIGSNDQAVPVTIQVEKR